MFHTPDGNPEPKTQLKIIGLAWKINNISESLIPFLPNRDKNVGVKTILRLLRLR